MEGLSKRELSEGLSHLIFNDLNQLLRNNIKFDSKFNYYFRVNNKLYNVNLEIKENK